MIGVQPEALGNDGTVGSQAVLLVFGQRPSDSQEGHSQPLQVHLVTGRDVYSYFLVHPGTSLRLLQMTARADYGDHGQERGWQLQRQIGSC
jgi:hypothetical protein